MRLSVGTEAYTQLAENLQKLTPTPESQARLSNGRAVSCAILGKSLLLGQNSIVKPAKLAEIMELKGLGATLALLLPTGINKHYWRLL